MSAALLSLMPDTRPAKPVGGTLGQLLIFIGIGASGAICFVALSSLIIWADTSFAPWAINAACYGGLILPVYLLQRRYSFRSGAAHSYALPRYISVQAMALLLAAMFSFVAHQLMDLPTVLASLLVIGLTSGVNFMILRGWAFASRPAYTSPVVA